MKITVAMTIVAAMALASTQAYAQSTKENRTLVEAKAYTDLSVSTEAAARAAADTAIATDRDQVDQALLDQIEQLQAQINQLAPNPTGPIVITQSANDFSRYTTIPTRASSLGHLFEVSGDGAFIVMGLTPPPSIGGVAYRLSVVEYCLAVDAVLNAKITSARVYHDDPAGASDGFTQAVRDDTPRDMAGCYTLNVPPLTPRGYSLHLFVGGQINQVGTAGIYLSNVRTTWVAVGT